MGIVRAHTGATGCIGLIKHVLCKSLLGVDCGRLRDPRYGDVDFSTTTFESKATYSCNKGFILVGVKTRVCQANGKWSGDMPVCKRKCIQSLHAHVN